MFRSIRQSACMASLGAAALTTVLPVNAAEYLVTPRLDQRVSYDNNLQLNRADDETQAYMYRLTAGADLAASGDRWRLDGGLALEAVKFDEDEFNSDNQFANIAARWFGQRSLFQFSAGIRRQAQRTAELEGSGLLGLEATRVEQLNIRPSVQLQLSERYQLTFGASLNEQNYETLNLNDYKNYGVDVSLARQMSDRMSVDVSIFGQEFETEVRDFDSCGSFGVFPIDGQFVFGRSCNFFGRNRESTTYGIQFGVRRAVSEGLQWNFSIGARDVESRDVLSDVLSDCIFDPSLTTLLGPCTEVGNLSAADTSTGVIANTGLDYRSERWRHVASLERSVSPVSLGFLVETDVARLRSQYQLRPTMTANADITYLSSGAATSASLFDRDYVSVQASLNWRVTERWRVVPGVRWREQDNANLGFDPDNPTSVERVIADSFSVFVNINYRPKQIQFSR